MKSMKPILLFSFLLFASVFASDLDEHIVSNNEVADYNDSDDLDWSDDEDFSSDDDEDIIYSGMISAKKSPPPPPTNKLSNSASLTKIPFSAPSQQTSNLCKKQRCKLNGYTPIWLSHVSDACKNSYFKLSFPQKADCQDKFCMKVCV